MGKSGLIGRKLAATFASTGTPSFFIHPGEAFHGDLGMINADDTLLLISNSGETEEIIRIIPFLKHQKNKIISLTGNENSTLGINSDISLDIGVEIEACKNNLAPTSSTTCTLVMGDTLAICMTEIKNFQPEDFARFHPGGSLGKKLLSKVSDLMKKEELPVCNTTTLFGDLVHIISKGRLGLAIVLEKNEIVGIITDGDIRRAFEKNNDFSLICASNIMTSKPLTVSPNESIIEAEKIMKLNKIGALIVVDEFKKLIGIIQIYN